MNNTRYKRVETVGQLVEVVDQKLPLYRMHVRKKQVNYRQLVSSRIPNMRFKYIEEELKLGLYTRNEYKATNRRYSYLALAVKTEDRDLVIEAICNYRQVRFEVLVKPGAIHEESRTRAIIWFFLNLRYGVTHVQCAEMFNRSLSTINSSLNLLELRMDKKFKFLHEMEELVKFINNYKSLTNTKELSNE